MITRYFIILFFVVITFISPCTNAQSSEASGIVSYTFYTNFGRAVQSEWKLVFKGNKSIFLETTSFKFLDSDSKIGSDSKTFKIKTNEQLTPHIISDFKKDSIYSQGLVFRDPFYVQDPILNPEWKLISETKTISGFSCNKATTNFRGRTYEVWFTPEIPVNFGPWKLNGLPGLILQATDDKGQVEFTATKVKFDEDIDIENQILKLPKLGEKVSLREYVSKKDKEGQQISKYISSKVSKGGNSRSSFEKPETRNSIEIIYEWEQE